MNIVSDLRFAQRTRVAVAIELEPIRSVAITDLSHGGSDLEA